MDSQALIDLHIGEPGIAVVMFRVPPVSHEDRHLLLHRILEAWAKGRPEVRIEEVLPLRRDDILYGLVAYLQKDERVAPLNAEVSPTLVGSFSNEYFEAVAADAATLACDRKIPHDLVVMINRREIAMVVDRVAWKVHIHSVDEVWSLLTADQQRDFEVWSEGAILEYFVANLDKQA